LSSLGKTLQTISMLAYLASYKGIWGPHLIIVPTSCLVNWEVEFKRFCPGLKVLCYYGNAKKRKELRAGWTKSNVQHVVITSYQLAVQDAGTFKRRKWYYMILDEGASWFSFLCLVDGVGRGTRYPHKMANRSCFFSIAHESPQHQKLRVAALADVDKLQHPATLAVDGHPTP